MNRDKGFYQEPEEGVKKTPNKFRTHEGSNSTEEELQEDERHESYLEPEEELKF